MTTEIPNSYVSIKQMYAYKWVFILKFNKTCFKASLLNLYKLYIKLIQVLVSNIN